MATWIIGTIVIGLMVFAGYTAYKRSKNRKCSCRCIGCIGIDKCDKE